MLLKQIALMKISRRMLNIMLLVSAAGIISSGIVQSAQADYGVAADKLREKVQDLQNNPRIPDSVKNQISSSLNSLSDQLLEQCERTSAIYPC